MAHTPCVPAPCETLRSVEQAHRARGLCHCIVKLPPTQLLPRCCCSPCALSACSTLRRASTEVGSARCFAACFAKQSTSRSLFAGRACVAAEYVGELGGGPQAVVSFKWNQFALKLLYIQLFMFAVWLLSFTVFTKLFQVCLGRPHRHQALLQWPCLVKHFASQHKHLCSCMPACMVQ